MQLTWLDWSRSRSRSFWSRSHNSFLVSISVSHSLVSVLALVSLYSGLINKPGCQYIDLVLSLPVCVWVCPHNSWHFKIDLELWAWADINGNTQIFPSLDADSESVNRTCSQKAKNQKAKQTIMHCTTKQLVLLRIPSSRPSPRTFSSSSASKSSDFWRP